MLLASVPYFTVNVALSRPSAMMEALSTESINALSVGVGPSAGVGLQAVKNSAAVISTKLSLLKAFIVVKKKFCI